MAEITLEGLTKRYPDGFEAVKDMDLERHVPHGLVAVRVALRDVIQLDLGHRSVLLYPFTAPAVSPATIRRWKISTMMMIGIVTTTAAAAMAPVGSSN